MNRINSGESQCISLELAKEMTKRFRDYKNQILLPEFRNLDILCNSETFDKAQLIDYFNKPEIHAIRFYYGMNQESKIQAILVGVDKEGKDILPISSGFKFANSLNGEIFESVDRCPPKCPPPSELNP